MWCWMCEELGDVDVAVNQGSVDPETIFVKYSNECGRLSASDIGNRKKSVVLVVVVIESHPFQSSSIISRLQIETIPPIPTQPMLVLFDSPEALGLRSSSLALPALTALICAFL